MNKLEMAHDWAMKYGKVDSNYNRENTVQLAWDYADAMQDEEDKRVKQKAKDDDKSIDELTDSRSLTKDEHGNCLHFHHEFGHKKCMDCGASLEEWQPDWSQAPDGYNWWAMDGFIKNANWYIDKPYLDDDSEIESEWNIVLKTDSATYIKAPLFNYQGNWQDSLRKRPNT